MDKIETPEEFARKMSLVHDEVASDGTFDPPINKWSAMLTARDALLRADERQKAAGRFREAFCQKCEQYGLHDRVNDPCPELARLRAAIMAEPKEGMK